VAGTFLAPRATAAVAAMMKTRTIAMGRGGRHCRCKEGVVRTREGQEQGHGQLRRKTTGTERSDLVKSGTYYYSLV